MQMKTEPKDMPGSDPAAPTVSIVVPVFNQGRYIEAALRSVLSQSGDFHVECIVMDGLSTDNTVDVLRSYSACVADGAFPAACRSLSLQWRSERDRGQAHAVNKAMGMATGEVFGWVNADDRLAGGAIEAALRAFTERPGAGFVYGDCRYADDTGQEIGQRRSPVRFSWRRFTRGVGQGLAQPAVFVKRDVALRVGALDEGLFFTLDQDWFTRMARHFDSHYDPRIQAVAIRHASAKTRDPLSPDYCAERVLVHARHGGRTAFVMSFASTVVALARGQGLEAGEAADCLSAAVHETGVRLKSRPTAGDVAHARSRAMQLIALDRVYSERSGAWRLLRGSIKGCSLRYSAGPILLVAAKSCLPRRLYRHLGEVRKRCLGRDDERHAAS